MYRAVTNPPRAPHNWSLGDERAILAAHENERRETLVHQASSAVAVLLCCTMIWGAVEWVIRPDHRIALILVDGAMFAVCITMLIVGRRHSRFAVHGTVFGINAVIACVLLYSALVGGSGELNVIAITLILGGTVALLPLGARNQLFASTTAIVGYPVILQFGAKTHLDAWYSLSGLAAAVFVAALGAGTIDRYRRRLLDQASANARLVNEANSAHEAKSEFLATVAHELRNPLGVIIGYTDLLREGVLTDPADVDDALMRIHGQALGTLDMLQNLLDIDKIEAGQVRLDTCEFDLAHFLDELRSAIPQSWAKDDVEITWTLPTPGITLTSDRRKLAAILRNLIHNASKYTHAGQVAIVSEEPTNGTINLSVSDTGEGIPASDLAHIFDRFRQARNSTRDNGVGLGLHIVKRFSKALGATIAVASEPGHGTRFVLTLPMDARWTSPAAPGQAPG